MNHDTDISLLARLRSLEAELETGKMADVADQQDLLTGEILSRACEILNDLLPGIGPVPTEFRELRNRLEESGAGRYIHRNLKPVRSNSR